MLCCCGVGQAFTALWCSVYRELRGGLTWALTRSLGVMLSGKAARLSISLLLLQWKCPLCCFSSLRVVVKEASVCRRIFAEKTSGGGAGSLTMQAYFR